MTSSSDWRYSDARMLVREQALKVLMAKFGSQMVDGVPKYPQNTIYECAHDWVSQGHTNASGIVKYYEAYYS
mgnify:FL=1